MYFQSDLVDKIRKGYYSALYFNRTKNILLEEKNYKKVTMQIFQKNEGSILCGIDEVLQLLKSATGYFHGTKWVDKYSELEIKYLKEGSKINSWEPVMHITGPYVFFVHLESVYLGILARRTLVATNSRNAVRASGEKKVIFFADRFDHFLNQEGDGYAAHIGGIDTVCTEAHSSWWKGSVAGTIPHSLIAVNDGNSVKAALQFAKHIKDKVIVLADFHNDCVNTSVELAKALKKQLWGVRIDTAENVIDKSFKGKKGKKYFGVNPDLVKRVRKELDRNGFGYVKIIVSGGFNAKKIEYFEKMNTPADAYGVGSFLMKGNNDFTADIVKVEGKKIAKHSREYRKIKLK